MSRRPDGRRGRRKPDPAEETASWLLEVEKAGQSDEGEDDWSDKLRATRREATGQFPPVPPASPTGAVPPAGPGAPPPGRRRPPAAEPPAGQGRWFDSERSGQQAGHDTGNWGGSPAAPAWGGTDPGAGSPAAWRQAEGSGVAEPPQEQQAWDTHAGAEPWNGRWPFEETSQSWESDDRSYTWPSQELPSNTGNWENNTGNWEAEAAPRPSEDPWASPRSGGYAGPPGYESTGYQAASPPSGSSDPGHAPDPGGYAPQAGFGSSGYEQGTGDYPTTGDYPPTDGYGASNGYEASNGYQGTGDYPAPGGYAAGGDYPAAGGYGATAAGGFETPGDPYAGVDPNTSGEAYAADPYAGGRDPYATGDQYPDHDPYTTGAYGGSEPTFGQTDPGGTGAADQRQAGDAAREPYPGHDPFAAYGLQNARRQHGDGAQAPGSTDPGQAGHDTGPLGAGHATGEIWPPTSPAASAAMFPPPRPESWPPQTGSWGIEEPPPRPRSAASGEFSRVLESDDEQVVRLGRGQDDRSGNGLDPGPRVHAGRSSRNAEARLLDDGDHASQRARWPRVVALISWIILLMVLCWFYVFPWLEKILPENF